MHIELMDLIWSHVITDDNSFSQHSSTEEPDMSFSHHVTQQDGIAQVLMEVLAMYALAH